MKRYIGYLLIIVGFLFVAIGLGSGVVSSFSFIPKIPSVISNILGLIFIIAGLYFSWSSSNNNKVKHASSEVPIYEGEGKDKKIVGYKKVSEK